MRGRKAVVLVSPGFIDDQERAADANRAIAAARRANVAVYFIDARGLLAGTPFAQAQFGSPLDSRDINAANADLALTAEGAETLANDTGGFSVRNQNDLGRGLKRIGDESRVYYLLGFEPDRANVKPGAFRRLEVKVARPGVTVRARRGYYAGDLPREATSADASRATAHHRQVDMERGRRRHAGSRHRLALRARRNSAAGDELRLRRCDRRRHRSSCSPSMRTSVRSPSPPRTAISSTSPTCAC